MREHRHRIPIGRRMLLASLLCAAAGASPTLRADDLNRSPSPGPSTAPQELLLVRAWNPETGELIGWMPLHRVAVTLQQLGEGTPSFDLNEAVAADFPYRPNATPTHGGVHLASQTAIFQGRKWIPAESEPNIIRIRDFTFLLKVIEFGESKWRRSTVINPLSQTRSK